MSGCVVRMLGKIILIACNGLFEILAVHGGLRRLKGGVGGILCNGDFLAADACLRQEIRGGAERYAQRATREQLQTVLHFVNTATPVPRAPYVARDYRGSRHCADSGYAPGIFPC